MFCENCGCKLDNDMSICPNCGQTINMNLQNKKTGNKNQKKPFYKSKYGLIYIIIGVLLLALISLVIIIETSQKSDGITAKEFISKFDDEYNKQFGTNISFDDWRKVNSDEHYSYAYFPNGDEYGYWSMQVLCNSETNKVYSVGVTIDESIKVPESWKGKVADIVILCLKVYGNLSQKDAEEKFSEFQLVKINERYHIKDDIYAFCFKAEGNLLMIQIGDFSASSYK